MTQSAFAVEEAGLRLTWTNRVIPWGQVVAAGLALPDPSARRLRDPRLVAALEAGEVDTLLLVQYRAMGRWLVVVLPADGDLEALRARLGDRFRQDLLPYAAFRAQLRAGRRAQSRLAVLITVLSTLGSCILSLFLLALVLDAFEFALELLFGQLGWLIFTAIGVGIIIWGARSIVHHGARLEEANGASLPGVVRGVIIVFLGVVVTAGALVTTLAPRVVARWQGSRGFGAVLLFAGALGVLWALSVLLSAGQRGALGAAGVGREVVVGAAALAVSFAALAAGSALAAGLVTFSW